MGQAASVYTQELEHVIQRGRVRTRFCQDREELLQLIAEDFGLQRAIAGPHPVAIAAQGIDFTIMRQIPERMGQLPAWEGIGAEARMNNRKMALEIRIRKVRVIPAQLMRSEHPLVYH